MTPANSIAFNMMAPDNQSLGVQSTVGRDVSPKLIRHESHYTIRGRHSSTVVVECLERLETIVDSGSVSASPTEPERGDTYLTRKLSQEHT